MVPKRTVVLAAGICIVAITVSGCGGVSDIPLPGGADIGSDPMYLTIAFEDVLDLVPQSAVKVDGVPVGRVESISVAPDGWTADVGVVVDGHDQPFGEQEGVARSDSSAMGSAIASQQSEYTLLRPTAVEVTSPVSRKVFRW